MSTATKTAPVLPISLTALPAGGTPYALTRYFEAREAWNADLTRDGKKVGFVAQDGRGGMTRALFDTRAEREAFEAHAATWEDGGYMGEHVLDALGLEECLRKAYRAKSRKNLLTIIPSEGDDPSEGMVRVFPLSKTVTKDELVRAIAASPNARPGTLWFNGDGWAPLT